MWEAVYATEVFGNILLTIYIEDDNTLKFRFIVFDRNFIIFHTILTNIKTIMSMITNQNSLMWLLNNLDITEIISKTIRNEDCIPYIKGFLEDAGKYKNY